MRISGQPLVTIITPVYNGAEFITDLIQSVQSQDYPHIEHIVIDDGSDDGGATRRVLEQYSHLRWWSRPNRGQYATVNEGIRAANGEIFTVISADDLYARSDSISTAVYFWQNQDKCEGVFGVTVRVNSSGQPLPIQPPKRMANFFMPYLPFICHCALLASTEKVRLDEFWWDESLRYVGDAHWILRMVEAGYQFCFVDHPIALYRFHEGQTSADLMNSIRLEEHRFFDRRFGVNPLVDGLFRAYLRIRHHTLNCLHFLRSK